MKKFAAFILSLCAATLTCVACAQSDNGQSSSSASESYQSNISDTASSTDESNSETSSESSAVESSSEESSIEQSSSETEISSSEEESSFEESSSEDSSSEENSSMEDSSIESSVEDSSFEDSSLEESSSSEDNSMEDSSIESSVEDSSSEESSSSKTESSNGNITLPEDFFGDSSSIKDSSSDSSVVPESGFTASERELFESYFGFVIPFIDSDEYYVEEYEYSYEDTGETEIGVNYYAYGLTSAEYTAYKNMFANGGYDYDGQEKDDYGDTWYYYSKDGYYIDFSYYKDNYGDYVLDVYVYLLVDGGNSGGNDSGNSDSDVDLMSNAGYGLPSDADGVHEVDFTKAAYVKNVTEQAYYLDGCPTVGSPAVLVIPVEFKDVTASSKGYQISTIEKAFKGGAGSTTYYSVLEYYAKSSYGQLNLDITVVDSWFKPQNNSSYYDTSAPLGCVYDAGGAKGSGSITNNSYVYYSASDSGSGVANLYVQKPGSTSFVSYNGTQLTAEGVYKFKARDAAGNETATTHEITLDKTSPVEWLY